MINAPNTKGQRLLYRGFAGVSIVHHRFGAGRKSGWNQDFEPGAVILCLNLEGSASLHMGGTSVSIGLRTVAVYGSAAPTLLGGCRDASQAQNFLIVKLSKAYWAKALEPRVPLAAFRLPVQHFLANEMHGDAAFAWAEPMSIGIQNLSLALIEPPIENRVGLPLWYEAKVFELISYYLFEPEDLPSPKRAAVSARDKLALRKRIELARSILDRDYENPPTLEMLASEVGCGVYQLSRSFSQETGMTIPQYLRQVRLERAERLLRSGRCNVTEAAFAVGYRSLSHFSKAFWEQFGCCPGLYGDPKLESQVRNWNGRLGKNFAWMRNRNPAKAEND